MADEDPNTLVRITHPGLPGDVVSDATVEAFETIWKDKGFVRVSDKDAEAMAVQAAKDQIIGDAPKKGDTK